MIWLVFAFLTGVAVFSVLWPLSRPAPTAREESADVAFYRAQIAEIEAEFSRGAVDAPQAEAAKAEAARRLIAVAPELTTAPDGAAKKLAAALALVAIPAVALGLYSFVGHPDLPDLPLQARLDKPPSQSDFGAVMAKMEKHIADHPEDGRAQELMAPVYLRQGRYPEAVHARAEALRLLGETPERLVRYAEALTYASDGVVSPEAVEQLERALKLDPKSLQARYYLGLAAAQHDDPVKAREVWSAMLPDLPEGSAGRQAVQEKLALLDAPAAGAPADAQPAQPAQQQMIRDMVSRLAERLATQGGGVDDWLRLIRSYKVLNETGKLSSALADARKALKDDPAAQEKLTALALELGLNGK